MKVTKEMLFSDYKDVADAVAAWRPKLSKLGLFGNKMLKQRNIDKWINSGIQSTDLTGKIVKTKELDKSYNGEMGTVIVWSPLSETRFWLKAKCS